MTDNERLLEDLCPQFQLCWGTRDKALMAAVAPDLSGDPPIPHPLLGVLPAPVLPTCRAVQPAQLHLDYSAEHPTDDITAEISCGWTT